MSKDPHDTIARLDESDAQELHGLLDVTWRNSYTRVLPEAVLEEAERVWHSVGTLRRQMKNKMILFAGYRDNGRILGMIRAAMVDETTLRVFQLYVLPEAQRRGIGTALLNYVRRLFPRAETLVLDVPKGSTSGVSFCRKYGFVLEGETILRIGTDEVQNIRASMTIEHEQRG